MIRKTRKKDKKIRYIEVENVKNEYLDAALISICSDDTFSNTVSNELKILKKAGITTQEIKAGRISRNEIIQKVSPFLLESYDFYNLLANKIEKIQDEILNSLFEKRYLNFDTNQWISSVKTAVLDDEISLSMMINILRFYKNGDFKDIIYVLLNNEEFVLKFYEELQIKIDGFDLDWENVIDIPFDNKTTGELKQSSVSVHGTDSDTSFKLQTAIKMLNDVIADVDELHKIKELNAQLESKNEVIESLKQELNQIKKDVRPKDSRIKSLEKENRALNKQAEMFGQKNELLQKEVGNLGKSLGELRKTQESLEKEKKVLERKVAVYEEKEAVVEKTISKEYKKKEIKLIKELEEIEKLLQTNQLLLNEEKDKNQRFIQEKSEMFSKIEQSNLLVKTMEIELKNLKDQTKKRKDLGDIESTSIDNEIDELFDFDENELINLINFDNKPTRN